jgi:L-ascorbate metabolism protein UlaG (beta-lactamase superfamily)
MDFHYYGHSTFSLITSDGTTLLFDPFFTSNPHTEVKPEDVAADYILVTHAHNDHTEDLIAIAKHTEATVIAMAELASYLATQGVNVHGMNIGGQFTFPFGTVKMTHAQHSSSMVINGLPVYMGEPAGFLLTIDGLYLYNAGDTSNFGDMALFGKTGAIDYAILPIGDNFTMGPRAAASAAQRLQAKHVIPVHYNTFPVIEQDPQAFTALLPEGVVQVVAPNTTINL